MTEDPALWDRVAHEHGGAPPSVGWDAAVLALRDHLATDDRVLDVGCGNGALSRALMPSVAAVHGIDVSPKMIGLARAVPSKATFEVGALEAPGPPAFHPTAVVLFNVLHHLDVPRALARCHALLPRGGLLFVFEGRAHGGAGHDRGARPIQPDALASLLDPTHFAVVQADVHERVAGWVAARRL